MKILNKIPWIIFYSIIIGAYVQNTIYMLNIQNFQMKMGEPLISIIGCLIPPVGVLHSFYTWYHYVS